MPPTEEAQATTDVTIQVNGKDLEGFKPDVTDYHLEYEGERPIVSAQGKNGTAVTVIDAKSANTPVLVKVVSEDGKLEKVYQLSLSAKAPIGSAIPEEGVKNLVHTKPELVIEPEEMDFERLERPNADLPKGEKRVVQEGQKGRKLRLVEVSQENGVESRKELDAFVELDPVAEITEVGTKEVLPRHSTTRATARTSATTRATTATTARAATAARATTRAATTTTTASESRTSSRFRRTSSYCKLLKASLEVKSGTSGRDRCSREGSRENSSNTSSFSCSSFRRQITKYRNGRKRRKPRCWNPSSRPC